MNKAWIENAQRVFRAHPSIATVSIVPKALVTGLAPELNDAAILLATTALWPACVVNAAVADLIGVSHASPEWRREELERVVAAATRRGLSHAWIVEDEAGAAQPQDLVNPPPGDRVVICRLDDVTAERARRPIDLGIDASWLLGGESGAQVFVFAMLRAMARFDEIGSIVLLSDSGSVPHALSDVGKVSGRSWRDAATSPARLDILHRPYQPGVDTDFTRYRQVARAVAVTVLDFIAYDNPAYHESAFAFRAYQRAFDAKMREADQVIAISRHVGDRLQRQFAHQLLAPVRSILLGADHLDARAGNAAVEVPVALAGVQSKQYLAVLGNDFAHKNRDFAVKVFAEMCDRGYLGRLVLAGFHLDAGSSFDYELQSAGRHVDRVLRLGSLTAADKTWLLANAAAVLYPTSSEGFGLIPFEAAALGTATAFVRFGPLAETMPDVPAAASWTVKAYADHVFGLIADPASCVGAINRARHALTWERCASETVAVYRQLLADSATWSAALAAQRAPGRRQLLNEAISEYARRLRRRFSGPSVGQGN